MRSADLKDEVKRDSHKLHSLKSYCRERLVYLLQHIRGALDNWGTSNCPQSRNKRRAKPLQQSVGQHPISSAPRTRATRNQNPRTSSQVHSAWSPRPTPANLVLEIESCLPTTMKRSVSSDAR
ncbi:unnamed protein product [Ectocarpus sp. 13 AM-2016]